MTVPTVWAVVLTVPVIHQQVGWEWLDPDADAKQVVSDIESRGIRYVAGDYWGSYLADYLADGRLQAAVDVSVRLADEQAVVNAADPSQVAYVYYDGATPGCGCRSRTTSSSMWASTTCTCPRADP